MRPTGSTQAQTRVRDSRGILSEPLVSLSMSSQPPRNALATHHAYHAGTRPHAPTQRGQNAHHDHPPRLRSPGTSSEGHRYGRRKRDSKPKTQNKAPDAAGGPGTPPLPPPRARASERANWSGRADARREGPGSIWGGMLGAGLGESLWPERRPDSARRGGGGGGVRDPPEGGTRARACGSVP